MTLIQSGEPKGSLLVQIRKIKGETNMPSQSIFDMKVSKVYPLSGDYGFLRWQTAVRGCS